MLDGAEDTTCSPPSMVSPVVVGTTAGGEQSVVFLRLGAGGSDFGGEEGGHNSLRIVQPEDSLLFGVGFFGVGGLVLLLGELVFEFSLLLYPVNILGEKSRLSSSEDKPIPRRFNHSSA